ncbi:MAG: pyruvate formate lyase-activating protein, partial [Ktedonobacterales bacterium]|nr:pyruvate formate lyase-activating protein [Ktedonobacterales bacterium]
MSERLRVLAVDIGTGTQDILLFESGREIENCLQFVLPSPTVIVAARIQRATEARRPVLLTGRLMGGGPCAWAARDHAQAGLGCYATADAARTLDDDLAQVEAQGLRIVSADEARQLATALGSDLVSIEMRDFDGAAIRVALQAFGVDAAVDALALAAFDHGAAPPGISDRRFRFDAIAARVRARPDALAFAYRREELPADLTRLAAVAEEARTYPSGDGAPVPVFVMDTGAAALAGALEDAHVRAHEES